MAGLGIENGSLAYVLYIMAFTLVGVCLSGPGPQGPDRQAEDLVQLKEVRVPLPGCGEATPPASRTLTTLLQAEPVQGLARAERHCSCCPASGNILQLFPR